MSQFEVFIRFSDSAYGDGILVSKYGDNYSLLMARESKTGGTIYKTWVNPQDRDKKPKEKSIPLGCKIGGRGETLRVLKAAIAAIGDDETYNQVSEDEDIPF